MKKLNNFIIFTFLFILTSCSVNIDENHPANREVMSKYKVIKVEGCEYILFYGNNSELRYDGVTHKGNCINH